MVIANISRNTVIEARGYAHGYGKLQEISLDTMFHNVSTFRELLDHYRHKKPIIRKDIQGMCRDTYPEFTIHSLESLFTLKSGAECHAQ